jgi:hypothetical protein
MKSTGPIVTKTQEAEIYFSDICRFLEEKIVQNLKTDFSFWSDTVYGCEVNIIPGFPEGYFLARLNSFGLDIAVNSALRKIGFDSPCLTVGDMANGKLGIMPHAAILKFKEDHRYEFQEWLKAKECNNFRSNPELLEKLELIAASRGKEAV